MSWANTPNSPPSCSPHLLQAEVAARTGRRSEAREHVRRGLACFEELAIAEGQNFEIAARTLRLANSLDEAEKLVERGLEVVRDFPVERAALALERGAIRPATRDYVGAREAYGRARDLYEQCGCRGRVREIDDVLRVVS